MTTATDNTAIIREGYERFAAQDVPGVLGLFSPAMVWTIPGPAALAGDYHGRDGVADFFGRIAAAWERLEVRPGEFVADGDRVVVLGRHLIEQRGASYDVPFAHAWTLADGLASSFVEYTDTALLDRVIAS